MKKKILITGGAGFIGSYLAEEFKNEYGVVIYDNYHRSSLEFIPELVNSKDVEIVKGDILDIDTLEKAMQDVYAVIHLAAIAGVSSYHTAPLDTLRVNIFGNINVLDAMRRTGTKRIINFSSSEVYGVDADNVSEEHPFNIGPVSEKRWVYATSKLTSEQFSLRYGEKYGIESTNVRPFNIYGPRQTGEGAISNFSKNLVVGKPIVIYGDGEDVRSWCYISDLVDGIKLVFKKPESIGRSINIGNPSQTVTVNELAELIIKVYGKGKVEFIKADHAPIRKRIPDVTLADELLGLQPKICLVDGLKATLEWHSEVMQ